MCAGRECASWDAGFCECAPRVFACATWRGRGQPGLRGGAWGGKVQAAGRLRVGVRARDGARARGARLTRALPPPPPDSSPAGRDAAPGPGAAPRRLLALPAAALRAPPALGLRAGERGAGLGGGRCGFGDLLGQTRWGRGVTSCSHPSGGSWEGACREEMLGPPHTPAWQSSETPQGGCSCGLRPAGQTGRALGTGRP